MEIGIFVRPMERAAAKTVKPALASLRLLLFSLSLSSFAVFLLDGSGLLYPISRIIDPFTLFWGLPGETPVVFISSIFLNIYSALGVISLLNLSPREFTILSTVCFIAHNIFVEGLLMKRTGSSLSRMILLRLVCALAAGWFLHCILPGMTRTELPNPPPPLGLTLNLWRPVLITWLISTGFLLLKITCILFGVLFIQKMMEEFKVKRILGKLTAPVMSIMGLSPAMGYLWVAANVIGIGYSEDILLEELRSESVSKTEADLFNHHVAISHAQIKDTLLFITLGVPYLWAALPRFILAFIVVWLERGRRTLFRRAFQVKIESD